MSTTSIHRQASEARKACIATCQSYADTSCHMRCQKNYQEAVRNATQTPTRVKPPARPPKSDKEAAMGEELGEQGLDADLLKSGGKKKLSKTAKIAIGVVALAAIGGAVYYFVKKRK